MSRELKQFASERSSDKSPELHASGYDTAVVLSFFVWKLEQKQPPDEHPYGALLACVWSGDHFSRVITQGGVFLTNEEKDNIRAAGSTFLMTYSHLAYTALERGEKLFKLRPRSITFATSWRMPTPETVEEIMAGTRAANPFGPAKLQSTCRRVC